MVFWLVLIGTFVIDQGIKEWVLAMTQGVEGHVITEGEYINLVLYYNPGVAWSLLAFLGPYLKWIQLLLIVVLFFMVFKEGYIKRYAFPAGLLLGGALGNLYDRFIHTKGVVDYIAWHYGFHFPVFNFADIAIDVAVVMVLVMLYFFPEKEYSS